MLKKTDEISRNKNVEIWENNPVTNLDAE